MAFFILSALRCVSLSAATGPCDSIAIYTTGLYSEDNRNAELAASLYRKRSDSRAGCQGSRGRVNIFLRATTTEVIKKVSMNRMNI